MHKTLYMPVAADIIPHGIQEAVEKGLHLVRAATSSSLFETSGIERSI
jgi:hypothetical protein